MTARPLDMEALCSAGGAYYDIADLDRSLDDTGFNCDSESDGDEGDEQEGDEEDMPPRDPEAPKRITLSTVLTELMGKWTEQDAESFYGTKDMTPVTEDGGVRKRILKEGSNSSEKTPVNSKVTVKYSAYLPRSGMRSDVPFDSTLYRRKASVFKLEETAMFPGFFHALCSMHIGEISKFCFEPAYAYGEIGCPPRIPKNSSLLYYIHLVDYVSPDRIIPLEFKTMDEIVREPFDKVIEAGIRIRADGNRFYKDGNLKLAVRRYERGINFLEDYATKDEEQDNIRNKEVFLLYMNKAQAYLRWEKPGQTCVAAKAAIRLGSMVGLKKELGKAYFRFARAKLLFHDGETALNLAKKARIFDPECKEIRDLVNQLQEDMGKKTEFEKTFANKFRKMEVADASGLLKD